MLRRCPRCHSHLCLPARFGAHPAEVTGEGASYSASYTVRADDTEGFATVTLRVSDTGGNIGLYKGSFEEIGKQTDHSDTLS